MKIALSAAVMLLLFAACNKDLSIKENSTNAETVSNEALAPLPCHSLTFRIDKPDVPGEVPSFRFTKTLYPDTRVRTINMLSRVYPIYPGYKKHAVELIGTFSYGPNRAYLKGTSQVWEYYKTAAGTGARRSISKKKVDLKFYITPQGYCDTIIDLTQPREYSWLEPWVLVIGKTYNTNQDLIKITRRDTAQGEMWIDEYYKFPVFDQFGNIVKFNYEGSYSVNSDHFKAEYDYNIPRGSKNYSFIPSQNLISQEYSLLEVMQWRPQPTHQRRTVAGVFRLANGTYVEQKQVYKNYKFDSKGNQTSVTYGDNVPQRTTWHCR